MTGAEHRRFLHSREQPFCWRDQVPVVRIVLDNQRRQLVLPKRIYMNEALRL